MGCLRKSPFVALLLLSNAASVLALGESYDQAVSSGVSANEGDPENSNLRGLSWFGFGDNDSKDEQDTTVPKANAQTYDDRQFQPNRYSTGAVKLIESVPCEPNHERARQFVSLFGDLKSGNEACAAEADPDACGRGCCRFGTYFLCDETNAFTELPCVCGRNTAANHPHEGHIHTTEESNGLSNKSEEEAVTPGSTARDGEGVVSQSEDEPNKSESFFTSVINYLEGKDKSSDDATTVASSSADSKEGASSSSSLDTNSSSGKNTSADSKEEASSSSMDEKEEAASSSDHHTHHHSHEHESTNTNDEASDMKKDPSSDGIKEPHGADDTSHKEKEDTNSGGNTSSADSKEEANSSSTDEKEESASSSGHHSHEHESTHTNDETSDNEKHDSDIVSDSIESTDAGSSGGGENKDSSISDDEHTVEHEHTSHHNSEVASADSSEGAKQSPSIDSSAQSKDSDDSGDGNTQKDVNDSTSSVDDKGSADTEKEDNYEGNGSSSKDEPEADKFEDTSTGELNEASFGLGWGGPPPDYDDEPDPGATKHHDTAVSSTPWWVSTEKSFEQDPTPSASESENDKSFLGFGSGEATENNVEVTQAAPVESLENEAAFLTPLVEEEDNSNRALKEEEEKGDGYDHGPINEVESLRDGAAEEREWTNPCDTSFA